MSLPDGCLCVFRDPSFGVSLATCEVCTPRCDCHCHEPKKNPNRGTLAPTGACRDCKDCEIV